jgi:hypothetical protein
MYLPALFPTLLRTTGAGFCYNIGRVVSAAGVVAFGLAGTVGNYRATLLLAGGLFLPAALVARFLPDHRDAPTRRSTHEPRQTPTGKSIDPVTS